ncbi:MAG: hypothetical protein JST26_18350 [Bacteroidetes bacterium]|nr:hypothetical protein [Bacteroidota bacterium]
MRVFCFIFISLIYTSVFAQDKKDKETSVPKTQVFIGAQQSIQVDAGAKPVSHDVINVSTLWCRFIPSNNQLSLAAGPSFASLSGFNNSLFGGSVNLQVLFAKQPYNTLMLDMGLRILGNKYPENTYPYSTGKYRYNSASLGLGYKRTFGKNKRLFLSLIADACLNIYTSVLSESAPGPHSSSGSNYSSVRLLPAASFEIAYRLN